MYDSDCNGKVSFNDIMEVLRDFSGPFMSDDQREVFIIVNLSSVVTSKQILYFADTEVQNLQDTFLFYFLPLSIVLDNYSFLSTQMQ